MNSPGAGTCTRATGLRSAIAAAVAAGGLVACTGSITASSGEEACPIENGAPATPSISSPEDGRRDIIGDALVLAATSYADPEGDPHLESAWEIWQVAGGEPVQRVWRALTDAARASEVTLADGAFEVGDALDLDRSYEVRVRYRAGAGCSSWSEWSAPRGFETDDGSAYFFAEDEIRDLYLDLSPEVLAALDAQAAPPGCVPFERESFAGTLTFEGQVFEGVGVKTKGGCGSSRGIDGKPSWKINLEWDDPALDGCPGERRLHAQKSLTLNNEVQDRSFVHEHLAYHFYRLMGVAAPRTNNVRVHVNGELYGLYLNLETVNRTMLGRSFASNDGMMYEGTYFCDLVDSSVPPTDDHPNDTDYCLGREFKADACSTPEPGADPTDFSLARRLVDQLEALPPDGFYPEVDQIFDFDTLLSMWAADAIMNHWDGFVYDVLNNYRIYHDPSSDRWSVIPSGADQTFTNIRDRSLFQVGNVVARRCLEEADCEAAFVARVQEALDVYEQADLAGRAAAIRDRLAADVMADPRYEGSYDEFVGSVDATIAFIDGRRAVIEQDLASR